MTKERSKLPAIYLVPLYLKSLPIYPLHSRLPWSALQVPPPLVGVRCDDAGGSRGFVPVLPIIPPTPVVLRIPRGILWHRGFVVWGTIGAAALGMLYTMCTLCMLSLENVGDASRRRTAKKHFD